EWHTRNDIARYEGYYASVFYSCFAALGLDVTVEDSSSHGRLDMAVRFNDHVYLFELKVVAGATGESTAASRLRTDTISADDASPGRAMAQLKQRRYADKYRHLGQPIHLIGVELDREARNVASWEVEHA
ncbi:MAG: PD-(D/E)XK nuclease domain-containing protein, partial [Chloroflexi bacterium]|nr:PD-(D/E)XK nuclease domain-containing protein [Chloroflexota bacterium]